MKLRYYQEEATYVACYNIKHNKNTLLDLCCGTGKSLVIASIIDNFIKEKPCFRVLMLVNNARLLQQNMNKLIAVNPNLPISVYAASLKEKNLDNNIVYAMIQSIEKEDINNLGYFDTVIVDEVQFIPEKSIGQYHKIFNKLKLINPNLTIIGLTGTPFRTDAGLITDFKNPIFNKIDYRYSIEQAIKDGFICPPISKVSKEKLDLSTVKISGHDYNASELELFLTDKDKVSYAVSNAIKLSEDRHSFLWFCCGQKHLEMVCEELKNHNRKFAVITSKTKQDERDSIIKKYENKEIQDIVSIDCISTGFDAPCTDCLVCLRPTKSTGLYMQIIMRGDRLYPGKKDFLVLDFAGLIEEHGSILDIKLKNEYNKQTKQFEQKIVKLVNNTKICPECQTVCGLKDKECPECHFSFETEQKVKNYIVPSELDIMGRNLTKPVKVKDFKLLKYPMKNGRYCLKMFCKLEDGKEICDYRFGYFIKTIFSKCFPYSNELMEELKKCGFTTYDDFLFAIDLDMVTRLKDFLVKPIAVDYKKNDKFYKINELYYV